MFTKALLFAVIAACGVHSGAASTDSSTEQPDEKQPPEEDLQEDQHFCCHDVDPKTWSGDGCVTIGPNQIDACAEVLYCPGKWAKHDGKVYCQ